MSERLDEKWDKEAAELRRQIGKLCAVPAPGSLVVRQRLAALEARCLEHAAEYRDAHPGWTEFSDEPGGMPEERGDMLLFIAYPDHDRWSRYRWDGKEWTGTGGAASTEYLCRICREQGGLKWLFVPLPGGGS